MPVLYVLFAIVAVPILFFMLTWVVITACKLFVPSKPPVIEHDPGELRRTATSEGYSIPVGAREIREDQRYISNQTQEVTYHYEYGDSEGLPTLWYEELIHRRN